MAKPLQGSVEKQGLFLGNNMVDNHGRLPVPKKTLSIDSPVFTIKLQKGLADRQRLPLADVVIILDEIRQMITDIGREIQRDMGIAKPTGDFGLELLGGTQGVLFKPGSLQAHVAMTSNIETGIVAAQYLVATIESLSKKKPAIATEADRSIVRRLNRINKIRDRDKTELQIVFQRPGRHKPLQATFDANAAECAWSLQAPVFEMEAMTIYGKLYELRDTDFSDESTTRGFWGELRRENGETWRVQFGEDNAEKAASLFRKQVVITGAAKYYRIASPKLIAADIVPDQERDYEKAFDELYGCDRKIYGDDFDKALKEMRGDE